MYQGIRRKTDNGRYSLWRRIILNSEKLVRGGDRENTTSDNRRRMIGGAR